MAAVSLVGVHSAGGTITGTNQSKFSVAGSLMAVVGDSVASHAPCPIPASHCAATMVDGSSKFTVQGIAVCRAGDAASCGHTANGLAKFDIA